MSKQSNYMKAILDGWWQALREEAEQGLEHPEEVTRRIEELGDMLTDHHLLEAELRQRQAAAARAVRAFARGNGVALPRSKSIEARPGPGAYAIEMSDFEAGPCVACGAEVGAGPVGWVRESEPGPLCDLCFKQHCPPLGTVLMLLTALRETGELECRNAMEKLSMIGVLKTLAQVAQLSVLDDWPPRPVDVTGTLIPALERLEERDDSEPLA